MANKKPRIRKNTGLFAFTLITNLDSLGAL